MKIVRDDEWFDAQLMAAACRKEVDDLRQLQCVKCRRSGLVVLNDSYSRPFDDRY